MLAEFTSLFPCRLDSAVKRPDTIIWKQVSRFHYLSDQEITESIQSTSRLLRAVSFDTKTRFLVVSVTANSPYHDAMSLAQIRKVLQERSLKTAAYQFQDSWYLYIYFSRPVHAQRSADILKDWFEASGYRTGRDTLQIFPNDLPLPLPLQPGFNWLDDDGNVLISRDELPLQTALELFHSDINKFETDPELLEEIQRTVQTGPPLSRHPANSSKMACPIDQPEPHSNPPALLQRELQLVDCEPVSLTLVPVPEPSKTDLAPPKPSIRSFKPEPEPIHLEPVLELFTFEPTPLNPEPVLPQPDHSEKQDTADVENPPTLELKSLQSACEPDLWKILSESLDLDLDRPAPINPTQAQPVVLFDDQTADTHNQIQYIALIAQAPENPQLQEPEAIEHVQEPLEQDPQPLKPEPNSPKLEAESLELEPTLTELVPELLRPDLAPLKPEPNLIGPVLEPHQPEPLKRQPRARIPRTKKRNKESLLAPDFLKPDPDPEQPPARAPKKSRSSRSRDPHEVNSKTPPLTHSQMQSDTQPGTKAGTQATSYPGSKPADTGTQTGLQSRALTAPYNARDGIQLILFPDLLTCERAPPDTG